MISCSVGNDGIDASSEPEKIVPSKLTLEVDKQGENSEYINGDGSGLVTFTVTAENAKTYGLKVDSETEIKNTSGVFKYVFTDNGTSEYLISVFAYSSTGNEASTFKKVLVYVSDNELQLKWSDDFNIDGAPDSSKWGFDTGNGCPNLCGWGNGEKQYYTNRSDNVIVEDGVLKIIAKKENYQGASYTSARLLTKDKYEFTYGRVDVRAKLPSGQGTWPAIWMLGANIDEVGWPKCGEIDIMEHWGHNPTIVSSATHTPACSGGCQGTKVGETNINDYATAFHIYSLEWTKDDLKFLIDGDVKYNYQPANKDSNTWPYNAPQFLTLNVALGGNWFTIDENFSEAVMEIDYIKVYQ
ncbi:glycoside hydrolase family 16 protein [Aestuariibaculum sediminum]|uniref:glycoside hydrolase family 16 protein n=1 Tax=Aestuariibaculum sediminum TaxID=2770637 RepID=UPI001CB6B91A|nr:glycoside hydrolase family 16 protein [Aestuariibaculum sediminum]